MGKNKEPVLFDSDPEWKNHWKGMPEFYCEDMKPCKSLTVHFETEVDLKIFSELIGQRIGMRTRSIWFPEATIERRVNKRYVQEP